LRRRRLLAGVRKRQQRIGDGVLVIEQEQLRGAPGAEEERPDLTLTALDLKHEHAPTISAQQGLDTAVHPLGAVVCDQKKPGDALPTRGADTTVDTLEAP
jgi:hypothetical protein